MLNQGPALLSRDLVRVFLDDALTYRKVATLSAIACLLTAAALPAANAGYTTILVGGRRPAYTPDFAGLASACIVFIVLAPALFVWLRIFNSLGKQPLEIVSSTPVPRYLYCFNRWLSDLILLLAILIIVGAASCVLVWRRNEVPVDTAYWQVFVPLLLVGIPSASILASARILFEANPLSRGIVAEWVFLVAWLTGITATAIAANQGTNALLDPFGIAYPLYGLLDRNGSVAFGFQNSSTGSSTLQLGEKILSLCLSPQYLLERASWTGFAICAPFLASLWFRASPGPRLSVGHWPRKLRQHSDYPKTAIAVSELPSTIRWLAAELKFATDGTSWRLAAVGTLIFSVLCPYRLILVLIAPIVLAVGSFRAGDLGVRATGRALQPLYNSLPIRQREHAVVGLAASTSLFLLLSIGILVRLTAANWWATIAWVAAAVGVSSLSLALGFVTRTATAFSVLSLLGSYALATSGATL